VLLGKELVQVADQHFCRRELLDEELGLHDESAERVDVETHTDAVFVVVETEADFLVGHVHQVSGDAVDDDRLVLVAADRFEVSLGDGVGRERLDVSRESHRDVTVLQECSRVVEGSKSIIKRVSQFEHE